MFCRSTLHKQNRANLRDLTADTIFVCLYQQTANKRNRLTFVAERLDDGLAEVLESGKVNLDWDLKKVSAILQPRWLSKVKR